VRLLEQLLEALVSQAGWQARRVHLLGFSQGGTAALELARRYKGRLGSVAAISACLLPEDAAMIEAGSTAAGGGPRHQPQGATGSAGSAGAPASGQEQTPVLITHGDLDSVVERADVAASLRVLQGAGCAASMFPVPGKAHGMIAGQAEAQALMQLWSQHLLARPADPCFMPVQQ
jgi:predicted esterase